MQLKMLERYLLLILQILIKDFYKVWQKVTNID